MYGWFCQYKDDRVLIEIDPISGHPKSSTTDDNLEKVH